MANMNSPFVISPDSPDWPRMVETTDIPGILTYERETFTDERGFFREVVELRDIEKVLGHTLEVKQWNHSQSIPKVIRGFHAEPWEKLIYVVTGTIMSVFVDFRTDSKTFGKAITMTLSEENRKLVYLPLGIGNSYCNIGDTAAEYMYLVTDYYAGKPTPAVLWNDPIITNQFGGWKVENPLISEKDLNHPTLKEKFGSVVDFSKFPWLKD